MRSALRLLLQIFAYAAMAALLGYFATLPPYQYGDTERTTIKLSISHATNRIEPCVPLTQEEIAELAANMRRTEACERERLPLTVELDVDGENVVSLIQAPSGVWNDGPASIYERFDVSSGRHTVSVRMRDTARIEGWDYEKTETVDLAPGRYFSVTFKAETGGFKFR
ncbi:MAG: hypothetical protein GWN47_10980 [Woeseiaceae bacterium]|nr:hypothetical protein [Woeseiaceae bacterium]